MYNKILSDLNECLSLCDQLKTTIELDIAEIDSCMSGSLCSAYKVKTQESLESVEKLRNQIRNLYDVYFTIVQ